MAPKLPTSTGRSAGAACEWEGVAARVGLVGVRAMAAFDTEVGRPC